MESAQREASTFAVEVTNTSVNGPWILIADREDFLPLTESPWLRSAKVAQRAGAATRAGRSAQCVLAGAACVPEP